MAAYFARRVVGLVPVLVVAGTVVFILVHLTPGDPAAIIAGPGATLQHIAALRTQLGLDVPLPVQYVRWFAGVLSGDLGTSLYFAQPVTTTLVAHAGPTLSLTALASLLALLIAVPSAVLAAANPRTPLDTAFVSATLLGVSIPSFWLALSLISVFAVGVRWFPVAGYVPLAQGVGPWLRALALPAFVLSLAQAGIIARLLRDGMLETQGEPFVRTAHAKGLAPMRVLLRHVMPNALIPALATLGTSVGALLGGAVVTETVFVIPGIGQLVVDSIARRDYPVIQGVVLVAALIYVGVNLLVDLTFAAIDPRIRYQ